MRHVAAHDAVRGATSRASAGNAGASVAGAASAFDLPDAGCGRGVRAASPTRAMRPCTNPGPRTSKTAWTAWTSWTDGPAFAIVMLGLSKRASGADIADRKAPESSLDRVD
ncbi:hypothetical protein WM26_13170 [Burkholderia cepacia]|nr:hypothetical protein WM26_13170 [Burkholderia cepacia]RQT60696.1 hypothetical protein DF043_16350 [Burkholderia cepacia]